MMAAVSHRQLELGLEDPKPEWGWGGPRPGAGRPTKAKRMRVPHRARPSHWASAPVHMTMRARSGLASFRAQRAFKAIAAALRKASRPGFRVVHFSVQIDHVHVIAEGDSAELLRAGCQGLAIRIALAFNRLFARKGKVWRERHERHDLRSPRQVRNTLVYVLMNHRKHARGTSGEAWAFRSLDPKSSALWFDGWSPRAGPALAVLQQEAKLFFTRDDERPVLEPKTWLANVGWRSGGLVDPASSPIVGSR